MIIYIILFNYYVNNALFIFNYYDYIVLFIIIILIELHYIGLLLVVVLIHSICLLKKVLILTLPIFVGIMFFIMQYNMEEYIPLFMHLIRVSMLILEVKYPLFITIT